MRWKQFLTPVKSMNSDQARKYIHDTLDDDITILDVRQHNEYEKGHISGAKLMPLPDLPEKFNEIDSTKPILVY